MTDRRTTQQIARRLSGLCLRCGERRDREGANCTRCNEIIQSRNRQRYRPGMAAAEWTMAFLARFTAVEMRGLV